MNVDIGEACIWFFIAGTVIGLVLAIVYYRRKIARLVDARAAELVKAAADKIRELVG